MTIGLTKEQKSYAKESAGALMRDDFLYVWWDQTVDEVIAHIRRYGEEQKFIHYLYVVDETGALHGVISLRDVVRRNQEEVVADFMTTNILFIPADLDQEEIARVMKKRDLLTAPVVDSDGRLLGVIHLDDVLDVVQEETTEDFHKMAPVITLGKNIKEASPFFLYRRRIGWLVILVFMNLFSGAGIAYFEDTITASIALVFFLPLLVDSGGNAGSQAATLMVRSLATGDITMRDWMKLFGKEVVTAGLLGATMALAVSVIGVYRGGMDIALIVSMTMILVVLAGSLLGMSLPFLLNKFNMDPATASAPLITSLADITGVLIYFSIANWYLGL
ncbi:magnesium transporter [Desmospora profundinema]|uniref:Magnesium transporter MgtE n=1 Tax=Desmospora profundinema TaxID=1571184 RepID=A0ABU1ITG6_9BACL|nr:magnesium transporter [Desmospora profundinema]MDR6227484.1 magnesium transporter [Desmospora profundinema]